MSYPIVKHFMHEDDRPVRYCCPQEFWEVFRPLQFPVCLPSDLHADDEEYRVITYFDRKTVKGTNQFQDMLLSAGLQDRGVRMHLDYVHQHNIEVELKGKPIMLVKHPDYKAGALADFNTLIPDLTPFQRIIDAYRKDYFIIQVGAPPYDKGVFEGAHLNLTGQLTVQEFLTLAAMADMTLTRVGFLLCVAEALGLRCFCIGSRRMLNCQNKFVASCTEDKVVCRPENTRYIVDDDPDPVEQFEAYRGRTMERRTVGIRCARRDQVEALVAGRRVVIFGGAPSCLDNARQEIEGFDTILRVNNFDCRKWGDRIGRRTDIYYTYWAPKDLHVSNRELQAQGCKLLWSKIPNADFTAHYRVGKERPGVAADFRWIFDARRQWFKIPVYIPTVAEFYENYNIMRRFLTTGVSAIVDVMRMRPKELYLTGFDFYESRTTEVDFELGETFGTGHLFKREKELVKLLYYQNKSVIRLDKKLKEVLHVQSETYQGRNAEVLE
jgi:hypothetical protein